MPPAYILLNIFPKCKFWMTTIISGVIGLLMMPWKQQGGDFLVVIQSNFSTLFRANHRYHAGGLFPGAQMHA